MRVTNGMMVNNLLRNLNKNISRMDKIQQQMASGKKFVNPSDDPIGVSRSLRLNTEVAAMEQYKRNAEDAQSWFSTTEMAVSNVNTILQRAKELTVQAATETNSVNERNVIAEEMKELKNQLVQLGNTTYAGSYIFSGFKTDKPLFAADGKYDIGGGTNKLTLDEVIEVNVGIGDRMGANSVGQRLFGLYSTAADLDKAPADSLKQQQSMTGSFLNLTTNPITAAGNFTLTNGGTSAVINLPNIPYNNLTNLKTDISTGLAAFGGAVTVSVVNSKLVFESNNELTIQSGSLNATSLGMTNNQKSVSVVEPGDSSQLISVFNQLISDLQSDNTSGISSALTRIDQQSDNINAIRAELGVKTNRVELTINRILDDIVNLGELLSKNEDADMAEVITNLKMEENVYNASLAGGAKVIQPSLVDFLR